MTTGNDDTNVANNIAQANLQDLTEQWKKGELPDGFYYFKMPDGAIEIASEYRLIRYNLTKDADKIKILAKVPSYEEYSRLEWYAGCGPDRIVELNKENRQLHKFLEEFNALDVAKENKKLKELLKECKEHLCHHYCQITVGKLEKKIEEVLK